MKIGALLASWLISLVGFPAFAENGQKISSMDFIQVQNGLKAEALYFYQNNWKKLRVAALEKGYIESYLLLQTEPSPDAPFDIVLVTTYPNDAQFQAREENFAELIKARGPVKLLNERKPNEFRKRIFDKDAKTL